MNFGSGRASATLRKYRDAFRLRSQRSKSAHLAQFTAVSDRQIAREDVSAVERPTRGPASVSLPQPLAASLWFSDGRVEHDHVLHCHERCSRLYTSVSNVQEIF